MPGNVPPQSGIVESWRSEQSTRRRVLDEPWQPGRSAGAGCRGSSRAGRHQPSPVSRGGRVHAVAGGSEWLWPRAERYHRAALAIQPGGAGPRSDATLRLDMCRLSSSLRSAGRRARDGRPLKMEGMPEHPVVERRTCAPSVRHCRWSCTTASASTVHSFAARRQAGARLMRRSSQHLDRIKQSNGAVSALSPGRLPARHCRRRSARFWSSLRMPAT